MRTKHIYLGLFRSASCSCYGKSSVCMQYGLTCHKITSLPRPSKELANNGEQNYLLIKVSSILREL